MSLTFFFHVISLSAGLKRKVKFPGSFLFTLQGQCKLVQLFLLHTSQNNQVQMMSSQMACLNYKHRYIYYDEVLYSVAFTLCSSQQKQLSPSYNVRSSRSLFLWTSLFGCYKKGYFNFIATIGQILSQFKFYNVQENLQSNNTKNVFYLEAHNVITSQQIKIKKAHCR